MDNRMKTVYLDHAASTPESPAARAAHADALGDYGNAGAIHRFGQAALARLDAAREAAATALGLDGARRFREIVFTGSATEANNLALRGAVRAGDTLVISAIEHDSVYRTAEDLARGGVKLSIVPVDRNGVTNLNALEAALDESVSLVSVMYVNNETGSIQPLAEVSELVRAKSPRALLHTDAVQGFAYLNPDPDILGVDLLTVSGHKIGGPKGVGLLYVRDAARLSPIVTGGGQEFGLRAGTENVPAIAAFAAALTEASAHRVAETERLGALSAKLWDGIKKTVPAAERNGGGAPHIVSVRFPHHAAADLTVRLDRAGVAVSAGTACNARSPRPSRVILAMHPDDPAAGSETLRFSLGAETTDEDIALALARLDGVFG